MNRRLTESIFCGTGNGKTLPLSNNVLRPKDICLNDAAARFARKNAGTHGDGGRSSIP